MIILLNGMLKPCKTSSTSVISILILITSFATAESRSGFNTVAKPDNQLVKSSCPSQLLYERAVLLVSSMDGKLTAVDLSNGGVMWTKQTGQKLISTSTTSLEIIYNGIPTRLVPSLDGSLFRFHDNMFEPVPFTAETLLSSSFRLSSESTMVGSKELITHGVDPACGQVLYYCDKEGCDNTGHSRQSDSDVLIIEHLTHTVRAASARTGIEKWNFSVSHHELTFVESPLTKEHYRCDDDQLHCPVFDMPTLKFVVQDGLLFRVKSGNTMVVDWRLELGSAISKSWLLQGGCLQNIDLFDPRYLPFHESIGAEETAELPALFIGIFEQQPYIQVSREMQRSIASMAHLYQHRQHLMHIPRVRWAPYITSAPSRTPFLNLDKEDATAEQSENEDEHALSVFHPLMDYPYDRGFYLYTDRLLTSDIPKHNSGSSETADYLNHEEDHMSDVGKSPTQQLEEIIIVQIVSLSYYWREVLSITLVCSGISNAVIWIIRKKRKAYTENSNSGIIIIHTPPLKQEPPPSDASSVVYQSRYQTDFDHIHVLGKGGFGVVYQARNKLDECEYAVKRITLLSSEEAKEKVTREVKALAKLDHPNIVRYFQSWLETPPAGWQEERDKAWESTETACPTPCNSVDYQPKKTPNIQTPEDIPKFKLEDSKDVSVSFGLPQMKDESLDIVFSNTSKSDQSVSRDRTSIPFKRYHDSASTESADDTSEDDSGYHRNCQDGTEPFAPGLQQLSNSLPSALLQAAGDLPYSVAAPRKTVVDHRPKLFLYIQMQLCKRETLRDYLNANTLKRDPIKMLDIFLQICNAVDYIHAQGLIHRDLKPTNIFFSAEDSIKVGDFGLVTALAAITEAEHELEQQQPDDSSTNQYRAHTDNVGTQLYMSPEQVASRPYNSKVDIYALGLVFFELLYPFSTAMERVVVLQNLKKLKFPERFQRELLAECELVKKMLARNPDKRPTVSEVMSDPVMNNVKDTICIPHGHIRSLSSSSVH